jgi:hypothetical protein
MERKRASIILALALAAVCALCLLSACAAKGQQGTVANEGSQKPANTQQDPSPADTQEAPMLSITANGTTLVAAFESNSSADALRALLQEGPLTLSLHDYGNFEKTGPLPWALPATDERIMTQPGDIVLYQGNQICIYYGENTWEFTRLASIDNVSRDELLAILGDGDVTVRFWLEWSE